MPASKNDWTTFTKRIPIHADAIAIYAAWTSQESLEKWFLRSAEFFDGDHGKMASNQQVQKGNTFLWKWFGYADDVFEKNEIIEANGSDCIQFGFTGCLVTVKIREEEGEHITELTQENIVFDDDPEKNLLVGCGEGWTFYLANLKSYLEGGIDLRNKNEKIKKVISS